MSSTLTRLAARHAGSRPADEFAPVELAYELHLTPQSAKEQMDFASTVAKRLPKTFAALAAGQIQPVHLRIIEDETRFLSAEDAAKADEILAGQAPGTTYGEVRAAAHKLVLKLDFGSLDGDDARDLLAAAARHPGTRWCITALNPDGTAAAHACLPGRHPPPGPAPPGAEPPDLKTPLIPSHAARATTRAPRSATTPAASWAT
jgi:hypothetical protein